MQAIPFIVGGLAATVSGGKLAWSLFRKAPSTTPYDVIFSINSLLALGTTGWEIVINERASGIELGSDTHEKSRGVIVAVLGSYNRGKSFLLNELCKLNLPSGNLIHTEGISITAARKQVQNVIFVDTAGTDTAIPKDKLDDKKATDALLREIAIHLSSFILIVVNRLRASDQIYIEQVLTHSKISNANKNVLIIHNLLDVETEVDLKYTIETEIEGIMQAKRDTIEVRMNNEAKKVYFFHSTHLGINLRHFVFAKKNSDAASNWNMQSMDGIMNILQTATEYRRNLDITTEIINFVNTKLPQLFVTTDPSENVESEERPSRLQVHMHNKKPHIVLVQRKDLDDLEKDPLRLELSPKLIYDDAGYFVGISSMNHGQWQPRYSLYETDDSIHAIIELAGFKPGEVSITVVEQSITVEGRRDDFKKLLENPIVHQSKIPLGQFKLEIPLKCVIEHKDATLERDDGLYKVKCPKKKTTATRLG